MGSRTGKGAAYRHVHPRQEGPLVRKEHLRAARTDQQHNLAQRREIALAGIMLGLVLAYFGLNLHRPLSLHRSGRVPAPTAEAGAAIAQTALGSVPTLIHQLWPVSHARLHRVA